MANRDAPPPAQEPEARDLLVFELTGELFGVDAAQVDAVVPWRDPVPLPGAGASLRGVVQDRGRVVTVLRHPTGRADAGAAEASRLVVCGTTRGFVGLPASATRAVGPVVIDGITDGVAETRFGRLTLLEPEALVEPGEVAA